MVVAFWPNARRGTLASLTLVGLAVAAALVGWNWDLRAVAFDGAISLDGITRYARVVLLAVGALTTLMAVSEGPRRSGEATREGESPPELFPLLLFALTGMVLLAAASDLLVVFIALEMLSLALYIMAGATRRSSAQEAAVKYFLLGAFSSAFLVYGIALCYGATRTTNLAAIARATATTQINLSVLLAGVALLAVGFCFKVAAVPFHMWTPDVYQGAPTPVTAFMAAVTMLGGAILAIVQTDLKRMLAYSSIAHAGYLLIGLAAAPTNPEGISASMFYLLAYAFMVMGAFMVVQYAAHTRQLEGEPGDLDGGASLDDFRGFGRRHPWPAALLGLFMFGLAGIPPLSGFWAKYYVFQAGVNAGLTWLVVIGVVSSVISAFFYLRVIMATYLQEPSERPAAAQEGSEAGGITEPEGSGEPQGGAPVDRDAGRRQVPAELALGVALGVAAVLTVGIGLAPQVLVTAAQTAGRILG